MSKMIRKRTTSESLCFHQRSPLWRSCKNFRILKQIHASMIVKGFNSDRFALREFVYAAAVLMQISIDYAHKVFDEISEPDHFMWNTMLRGSAQSPKPQLTISLFSQMEKLFILPDQYTFPFVLKACSRLAWIKMGYLIHGKVIKHGFEQNTFVRNSLIYLHSNVGDIRIAMELFDTSTMKNDAVPWSALTAGYAKRGDLRTARDLFDRMPVKDLISWNVMITGYVKQGEMEAANELFHLAPKRDVVTWNAMISGYVSKGEHQMALGVYEEMRAINECPDEVTILCLISVCASLGALEIGEKIHSSILDMGEGVSIFLWNALIDMYAKCGCTEKALHVFCSMKEKDVASWTSIIVGLAFSGCMEKSISIFEEMRKTKFCPNEITFVGVLVACSLAGKVDDGRAYFKLMQDVYNIQPNLKHYGCMVDLFGRAGMLNEAFDFIETMCFEPNAVIWRTLLGACRVHCNVELGRRANERLLELRRDQSGDYVLLSNIYASNGDWCRAEDTRKLMDENGVAKGRGFSSVDDEKELRLWLREHEHESHVKGWSF